MPDSPTKRTLKETFRFVVYGKPRQRGSKSAATNPATGKIHLRDASKHSKQWMKTVAQTAGCHFRGRTLLRGPVRVYARFYFGRPKSHFGTGRNADVLKASAPAWHIQTPDISKLARAIEDAMTGVVYADDKQICEETLTKQWTCQQERVEIAVTALDDQAPPVDERQGELFDVTASEVGRPF